MKLVLTGFHAKQLAVNPQLSLNPTDNKDLYLSKLHTYDFEAKLLRQEFEYVLWKWYLIYKPLITGVFHTGY